MLHKSGISHKQEIQYMCLIDTGLSLFASVSGQPGISVIHLLLKITIGKLSQYRTNCFT